MSVSKLYRKKPCKKCPFLRENVSSYSFPKARKKEILDSDSFICHETLNKEKKQCSGHMIIKGSDNIFMQTSRIFNIELKLKNRDNVCTEKEFMEL